MTEQPSSVHYLALNVEVAMPKDFKEFAVKELLHAEDVLAKLDSGEWEAGPELRSHYKGLIEWLKNALGLTEN